MRQFAGCLVVVLGVVGCLGSAEAPDGTAALCSAERLAWLRNWTAARPFYAEAERQFQAAGDRRDALFSRISLIRADSDAAPYLETSQYLDSLLDDPLVQSDLALRLRCLAVKGDFDMELDTDRARRDWTEARGVAEKLGDKAWVSRADGELAIVAYLSGDITGAALGIFHAIQSARERDDVGSLVRYEGLVGHGMVAWGEYEKALKYFDDALKLAKIEPDVQYPLLIYSGQIDALIALGRTTEARQLLDAALAEARSTSATGYEAELHESYGLLEWKHGERSRAVAELETAIRLGDEIAAQRISGQSSLTLAQVLESASDWVGAQRAILRSVANARLAGDRLLLPAALAEAGRIDAAIGKLSAADDFFEEASDIASGIVSSVPTLTAKDQFIATLDALYVDHFRLHAKRHDTAGAFRVLEEARGRAVADALRDGGSQARPLTARLTAPERRVAEIELRLMRTHNKAERQRLRAALERSEEEEYPALIAPDSTSPSKPRRQFTLTELQHDLPAGQAVLEYLLAEPRSYCLFVMRDRASVSEIPGKAQIVKAVAVHLAAIKARADFRQSGRELFKMLFPQGTTVARTLIVVPDGPLWELPFDTAVDDAGRMLVNTRTVSYAPSGTVLHLLLHRRATTPPILPLLAVATGSGEADRTASVAQRGITNLDGTALQPLAEANGEVRTIAGIVGPKSVVITGSDATKTAVMKQPLARYRVLHFAVHGVTSPDRPERSGLAFFPDGTDGGLWQMRDIVRTKLQADLVTLSTCHAGSGKVNGTAGVANLSTAFLAAGAKSVVANLWDSADTFTSALMARFYGHLAQRLPAAEALRLAKLEMIERYGPKAPPILWAGFTLTGLNEQILP